jgi:hypothetical protein
VLPGAFEQMRADGVEPVVFGDPVVGFELPQPKDFRC